MDNYNYDIEVNINRHNPNNILELLFKAVVISLLCWVTQFVNNTFIFGFIKKVVTCQIFAQYDYHSIRSHQSSNVIIVSCDFICNLCSFLSHIINVTT